MTRLARFAWLVLGWNVAVILWGAFVRATGSGAGCGAHWPLCNGEVVPRAPALETMIEFTHRATSGVALLLVLALVLWVYRERPKGHPARRAAGASLFFFVTEAAVGAGLVLLRLVGQNDSVSRAFWMAGHLANTFVLLACLTLTAHWCASEARLLPAAVKRLGWVFARRRRSPSSASARAGPWPRSATRSTPRSRSSAVSRRTSRPPRTSSCSCGSRTRSWPWRERSSWPSPPSRVLQSTDDRGARRAAWAVSALSLLQLGAGLLNVALLAPVWMQIVHLLLADLALDRVRAARRARPLAALPAARSRRAPWPGRPERCRPFSADRSAGRSPSPPSARVSARR